MNKEKETMNGLWSGYSILVTNSMGKNFKIDTISGVRGTNIPVVVTVEDGKWRVTESGQVVPIKKVTEISSFDN